MGAQRVLVGIFIFFAVATHDQALARTALNVNDLAKLRALNESLMADPFNQDAQAELRKELNLLGLDDALPTAGLPKDATDALTRAIRYRNLGLVQEQFAKCLKTKTSSLNAGKRVLDATKAAAINSECLSSLGGFQSEKKLAELIAGAASRELPYRLEADLYNRAMRNAAANYARANYLLNDKQQTVPQMSARLCSTPIAVDDESAEPIQVDMPVRPGGVIHVGCTPELKAGLEVEMNAIAAREASQALNAKRAAVLFNQQIASWRDGLRGAKHVHVDDSPAPQLVTGNEAQVFDSIRSYGNNGIGRLLEMGHLKDKIEIEDEPSVEKTSLLRNPESPFFRIVATEKTFKSLKEVREEDLVEARDIALKAIERFTDSLHTLARPLSKSPTAKEIDRALANLPKIIKMAPAVLGEVLVDHPEYAATACQAINQLEEDHARSEKIEAALETSSWIAAAVPVGTFVVGGGMKALGYGLQGSRALRAAQLSGGALAGVAGTYTVAEATAAYQEAQSLYGAFYSRNGDAQTLQEARDAEARMHEEVSNSMLMMATAGIPMSLKAASKTLKRIQSTNGASGKEAERLVEVVQDGFLSHRAAFKQAGLNEDEMGRLAGAISSLPDEERKAVLAAMRAAKGDPAKLRAGAREALEKVEKRCGS